MGANIQYKNSVFSLLFSDPEILRELYRAVGGVDLPPSIPITINTLQDALFMARINDISFEAGGKLIVLIEHQSTINPNIPLRLLMYIARIYEKIVSEKNIYSGKQIPLPRPEFFVLYNGVAPYPDTATLKLSDAFEDAAIIPPELDLAVKVININQGRNDAIIKQSERLKGYSAFIAKVREYEQGGDDKETTMKRAIQYCIKNGILEEFLERNSSEVINMLLTEWNWDDAKEVWQAEAREEGIEQGREFGRKDSIEKLMNFGMSPEQIATALKIPLEEVVAPKR
jgi:hypothetical protein